MVFYMFQIVPSKGMNVKKVIRGHLSDLSARIGLPKAFKLTGFGFVPTRPLVWLQIKPFGL